MMKSIFPFVFGVTLTLQTGVSAFGDDSPAKLEAVYQCTSIPSDADRLACFDAAVAEFQTAESSGEIIAVSKEEVQEAKKEGFGFNLPSLSGIGDIFKSGKRDENGEKIADPLDRQVMTIERVKTFNHNRIRFYFTNGQVWEQITSDRVRVPKIKDDREVTVLIKKAALGSFLLQVNGKGKAVRVRRVK